MFPKPKKGSGARARKQRRQKRKGVGGSIDWADSKITSQKRKELWIVIVRKRGLKCQRCGETSGLIDLAEGFVSRGDVQGWPVRKRDLIFHEYNCFLLCRKCHKEYGFDREWAWWQACNEYGQEEVRAWYEGLPWKKGAPRVF